VVWGLGEKNPRLPDWKFDFYLLKKMENGELTLYLFYLFWQGDLPVSHAGQQMESLTGFRVMSFGDDSRITL
jgi:hypothetical protein